MNRSTSILATRGWLPFRRVDATSLAERRIGKISFLFQGPQPLLHFQRFDANGDSVSPSWEQAVPENSLVTPYGRVGLRAD